MSAWLQALRLGNTGADAKEEKLLLLLKSAKEKF